VPDASLGDLDCNGVLEGKDVLLVLDQNDTSAQGGSCPAPGDPVGEHLKADVNCDGVVDPKDALVMLLKMAGLPLPIPSGCPGP
jgi:hypothetical protein